MTEGKELKVMVAPEPEKTEFVPHEGLDRSVLPQGTDPMQGVAPIEDMPLFANPNDAKDNPNLAQGMEALQSIMYSDSTPEDRAEQCKKSGNDCLHTYLRVRTRQMIMNACHHYTKGLQEDFDNDKLRVALLSNRAQAYLYMENWRSSLESSQLALRIDAEHFKSMFRAAKACIQLSKLEEAHSYVNMAIDHQPDNVPFKKLAAQIELLLKQKTESEQTLQKYDYYEPLKRIGVTLGLPMLPMQTTLPQSEFIINEKEGTYSFPLMLLYPETEQNDYLHNVEASVTFHELANTIFGPSAPPATWDKDGRYTVDSVDFYFKTNWTLPICKYFNDDVSVEDKSIENLELVPMVEKSTRLVKIPKNKTLHSMVTHDRYMVPYFPIFYVIPNTSYDFIKRFSGVFNKK
ncbi:hypothetical protein PCE1_003242 [Barthelona sp. PCE]